MPLVYQNKMQYNISLQFTNQLICMQVNFPSVRYNTFSYTLYIAYCNCNLIQQPNPTRIMLYGLDSLQTQIATSDYYY